MIPPRQLFVGNAVRANKNARGTSAMEVPAVLDVENVGKRSVMIFPEKWEIGVVVGTTSPDIYDKRRITVFFSIVGLTEIHVDWVTLIART